MPHRFWWKVWLLVQVIQARLRFVAILAFVGFVLLYWGTITAHVEKWTRPVFAADSVASADTEYWCPMHPTIVRDHPDKCPICGMPLSKRKKGEGGGREEALPPGVVSRVQLTPYREWVAGIETVEAGYQPLTRDISASGFVEFDETRLARITARAAGKSRLDKLLVNVTGQTVNKGDPLALLYSPELVTTVQNLLDARQSGNGELQRLARDRLRLWGIDTEQINEVLRSGKPITQLTIRSPISGHVIKKYQLEGEYVEEGSRLYDIADLSTVWIEAQVYEDELAFLQEGLTVAATTRAFPNREFPGELSFIHPHLDAATRTLKVRFNVKNPQHELRPGMFATVTLRVPATQLHLLPADASAEQKQEYDQGLVLAVPERAVIDTGKRKIVYREAEPDVFDGVEVELGPRCGGFYPVVRGLQAGDRVASAGSFLIDAETRLTAGAGSTYFGASGGPQTAERHAATVAGRPSMTRDALARLSAEDRRLAELQGTCPETGQPLGAMGVPLKVVLRGQTVFLCCGGCEDNARAHPDQTLARVEELKARHGQKR